MQLPHCYPFDTGAALLALWQSRYPGRVLPVSVTDFRALAKARLPHFLFEYLDGGANAEATLRANAADLEALALRQRVLAGTDPPDTGVALFGRSWRLPVALAPVGLAGMYARRGERQAARAADGFGVPFTLSTVSVCPIEEVRSPFWMQLYVMRDRGFLREVIARAKAAGCGALMFTVDMPVAGVRYRDYRSGLAGAPGWQAMPAASPKRSRGRDGPGMWASAAGPMCSAISHRCCAGRRAWRISSRGCATTSTPPYRGAISTRSASCGRGR